MIDIRYHFISLMAVFLALALGIVIGSSMAPSTSSKLVDAVKHQNERVDAVLAEYDRDHAVLGRLEQALSTIIPPLMQGRLDGHGVAIIQTGDQPESAKAAADAVVAAGGTVLSTTILTPAFDELSDEDVNQIRAEMPEQPSSDDGDIDLIRPLAAALRQGAPDGAQTDTYLSVLRRERLITMAGDYTRPVTLVVIVGGARVDTDLSPERMANRETTLINLLTGNGSHMTVVGGEAQGVVNSSIATFRNAGIATVDCLDRSIGKLDLVYALGGDRANYGVRTTADRLLPSSVEAGLTVVHVHSSDASATAASSAR
ncbi:MAG: copper transporter [Capsulimonadaceae bacterium]|nr:copper transporter [Capsulimonadaceae bacterium]